MSVSSFLLLTLIMGACPVLFVASNGIPSKEALQAKNPEEFLAAEKKMREKSAHKRLRETFLRSSKSPLGMVTIEKSEHILANYFDGEPGFYHGVASGDPLPDAVVLWTRYTPETEDATIMLELFIAEVDSSVEDQNLFDFESNEHIRVAEIEVTKESDFVAKVDVVGLKSNAHYVFAFTDGDKVSDIGQTRTAPALDEKVETMTYAFFSCAHFSNGYFHSYDVASTIKDLDFWVHVGDYIYEYGDYEPYASDVPERKAQTLVSAIVLVCFVASSLLSLT
jgi:Phosphodiesterase/alkaline phosphatase D